MITAERILIGKIPFEKVKIYTHEEDVGLPNYFEDAQIVVKCKDGTFIVPSYKITMILLRKKTTKLGPKFAKKYKRLVVGGECSYSPAYVVHSDKHADVGIPQVFKEYEQFAFACIEGLYITTDFNVLAIEV